MSRSIPVSPAGHHPKYKEIRGNSGIRNEITDPQTNHQLPCTRSVLHRAGKLCRQPRLPTILFFRASSDSLGKGASLYVVLLLNMDTSSSEGIGGISRELWPLILDFAIASPPFIPFPTVSESILRHTMYNPAKLLWPQCPGWKSILCYLWPF